MRRVWALDFGAEVTLAAVAEESARGEIRLLGLGDAPSRGVERGEVVCVGDIVESIHEAVAKARQISGLRCERIFYNYDDVGIERIKPCGSKALVGEGQISRSDIRDAERVATRSIGHFEKSTVHSGPIYYLMDGKDLVTNPVGVFGHDLEVQLHVLMGRALHLQKWRRVFERLYLRAEPVVTVLSSVHGVLDAERMKKRVLLWDLGADQAQAAVAERGILYDFCILRMDEGSLADRAKRMTECTEMILKRTGLVEEIVLTGDLAERDVFAENIADRSSLPLSVLQPLDQAGLTKVQHASLAGLIRYGFGKQRTVQIAKSRKEAFAGLKEKASAFLNDNF